VGGCTLQVIQPQRWEDKTWRIVASLEAQLGCLVGVNAYLTPRGTQGLAPHTDEVVSGSSSSSSSSNSKGSSSTSSSTGSGSSSGRGGYGSSSDSFLSSHCQRQQQ